MIVSYDGLRVRLRGLELSDMHIFNSEFELSFSYLKRSDMIWLPHNSETIESMVISMVDTNKRLPFPLTWVIEDENSVSIGILSLHTFDTRHRVFSYGISLKTECQGRGYAFEAVNLILNYMFINNGYFKCIAKTYSFNNKSIALQKKIGFKTEGILKESYYLNGKYEDVILWGIDRSTFQFMHVAQ